MPGNKVRTRLNLVKQNKKIIKEIKRLGSWWYSSGRGYRSRRNWANARSMMPFLERNPTGSAFGSDFLVGERRGGFFCCCCCFGGCSWFDERHLHFHCRVDKALVLLLPGFMRVDCPKKGEIRSLEGRRRWVDSMREEGMVASGREVV